MEIREAHCDHLVVASGVFSEGCVPHNLPGCEKLLKAGVAIHSSRFRGGATFAGGHVAVVGASFSGTTFPG